jgi:phosphohistidine swiveling domain-containing protein
MFGYIARRLKWLGLLAALSPFAVGPIAYMSTQDANEMRANGVEATAEIEGGTRSKRRRSGTSFSINLSWKDQAGQTRTAEKVHIGRSLADKIIRDDALIVETIKIKYLPNQPEKAPVAVEEMSAGGDPLTAAATMVGITLPISVVGGLVFWFLRRRDLRKA